MSVYLGVMLAGALGAVLRYLVDTAVQGRWARAFPLGTLVINVSGSLVLGFLTGLALYHALPDVPKAVLGAGFCGAFTTFSTFAFETVRLAEEGDGAGAAWNLTGNLVLGTAAAVLGLAIAGL